MEAQQLAALGLGGRELLGDAASALTRDELAARSRLAFAAASSEPMPLVSERRTSKPCCNRPPSAIGSVGSESSAKSAARVRAAVHALGSGGAHSGRREPHNTASGVSGRGIGGGEHAP